jgi:hypothetical protein
VNKQDRNGVRTAQDLERKYNLSTVKKAVEVTETELVEVKNDLSNFVNESLNNFEGMQKEIEESLVYLVEIHSTNGNVFKNGDIATTLSVVVKKSNVDITDQITDTQVYWERISKDVEGDVIWNNAHKHTKAVAVANDDINVKAVFNVYVDIRKE